MSHAENGLPLNIVSPSGSSLPNFSSDAASPLAWNDRLLVSQSKSQQDGVDGDQTIAEKLFGDDEKHVLDTFFSERLGETSQVPQSASEITSSERSTSKQRELSAKRANQVKTEDALNDAEEAKEYEEEESRDPDSDYRAKSPPKRAKLDTFASWQPHQPASSVAVKRSNHIASEQRRRTTIKENYKLLVDLLLAGEATSGISLASAGEDESPLDGQKAKGKGRGRGRKGQDGAGATKSVVLEKAGDYLKWLEKTNAELEKEVMKLEAVLTK